MTRNLVFPRYLLTGAIVSYIGLAFLLFEFPNNIIQDINLTLSTFSIPLTLPPAFESVYAFAYALIPTGFGLIVTVLFAKGVKEGEA